MVVKYENIFYYNLEWYWITYELNPIEADEVQQNDYQPEHSEI